MRYTALSIGPIYKTLMSAKKTRELWGSSYIFSFFMKNIIIKLLEKGVRKEDFITPYVDDVLLKENSKIGKFHDRLIYRGNVEKLKEAIDKSIEEFANLMADDLEVKKEDILNFIRNYFKFYMVEKDLNPPFTFNNHPIKVMNEWLNCKELFFEVRNYKKNYLYLWLKLPKNRNSLFSKLEEFKRFKSLPEIALSDIKDKQIKKLLTSFNDELKIFEEIEEKFKLKPFHKYIAIVHADGDNLSKALQGNSDDIDKEVKNISKKLFEFSTEATKKIKEFEGEVIYAGGDDLLFFAPVVNNDKTIFNLLDEIRTVYEDKKIKNSTISFGVSITYYKFPLNEALNESRRLLFEKAKNTKNSTAFRVIKHSGQYFESIINHQYFEKFLYMLNYSLDVKNKDEFLHSLYSKIFYFKEVLKNTNENRLGYFFENNFNENYDRYKNFFDKVLDYYVTVKDIENLYATLRLMKFLKGDK